MLGAFRAFGENIVAHLVQPGGSADLEVAYVVRKTNAVTEAGAFKRDAIDAAAGAASLPVRRRGFDGGRFERERCRGLGQGGADEQGGEYARHHGWYTTFP